MLIQTETLHQRSAIGSNQGIGGFFLYLLRLIMACLGARTRIGPDA